MTRTKLSIVVDCMLATFCISLVCFAWLRKYINSIVLCLIITFALACIMAGILLKLSFKKNSKLVQSNKDIEFQKQCFEHLSLNKRDCEQFFAKLLDAKKLPGNFFASGQSIYYINYEEEQLSTKDICKIKNKNYTNIIIFAHALTDSAMHACQNFGYKPATKQEVYSLMKAKNEFPITQTKTAKSIKNWFKTKSKDIFNKKKAKHYLFYGVLLLIISFIVPFTFMYCVFGTMSIIFGLLCLFKKPLATISK